MVGRLLISVAACGSMLCADTLVFKRGGSVDGQFVGGDNRSIRFVVGNQVNIYNISDVVSLRFNTAGEPGAASAYPPPAYPNANPYPYPSAGNYPPSNYPSSNYPPPQTAPPPASYPQSSNYPSSNYPPPDANGPSSASNAPVYPPPSADSPNPYGTAPAASAASRPLGVEVPPDTPITVSMIDPVNSATDRLGKTYRGTVDEPVIVANATAIPRGSDVVVALVAAQDAGRVQGQTQLTLVLKSITVNGTTYDVRSTRVTQAAASRSKRSAEMVGGAAALGAVIGAIAGGGKGAAIGAVAGGGAGTAAAVMTKGDTVKVPAETRLVFQLQNPLDL